MTFDNFELSIILDEIEKEKENKEIVEVDHFWLMFFTIIIFLLSVLIGFKKII